MAAPSYTYTLTNGTTADAAQVMQNFTDILNGITDGTKDISISALTCAGTATFNGNVGIGNASGDDLTITSSLTGDLPLKTANTSNIGGATLGLASAYFGNAGSSRTLRVLSAAAIATASRTYTMPDAGADAFFVMSTTASRTSFFADQTTALTAKGSGTTQDLGNVYTEVLDPNSNFASGVFTAPVAGVYLFSGSCVINADAGNTFTIARLLFKKNSSYYRTSGIGNVSSGTISNIDLSGSIIFSLAASDTVQLAVTCTTSAGTWSTDSGIANGAYFCGHQVI